MRTNLTGKILSSRKPPQLATWLLTLFLSPAHDSLIGDMEEEFCDNVKAEKYLKAALIYNLQTIKLIPILVVNAFFWSFIMLKNYLTITFRTLRKYKTFSFLNILGLSIGMPVCLLIILLNREQSKMDRFHENKDRIYRIITTATNHSTGQTHDLASSPALVGQTLQAEYHGVKDVVRLARFYAEPKYEDKILPLGGFYVDDSFFKVFNFQLSKGDPETVLTEPFSMVVSNETANRFFGNDDPVGKILSLPFGDFRITGLLTDLPEGEWDAF